ncbi:urea carboxylase [Pseudonocardia sp. NPDC046786]|uniref:urea carboxylase n=1 Tax=Pseudonocardia sp. NPDC046786 TaxID=3155471 RepID=UPI0033D505FD
MFDTLLVANRGEIARRIIRSARALGLRTVAVYSDADSDALHVLEADHAVRLGPAPPAESYLRADAVLGAATATGAGAVHPGYGFLAENAGFAESCERAGLRFVGPTPGQLRAFGDKHAARTAARAAGVPVQPGSGLLGSAAEAVAAAAGIGYPVVLKAVGGGGGIGMRVCHRPDEVPAAFASVTRTAAAQFGSSGVFCERYVTRARHVEVQLFGDGAGRVVSLGTRDCTLQRRHQKVVEEAPAPDLPPAVAATVTATARALARSVAYRSAGTVEFVYDADRCTASFLEVNTRLQVEHPVTELVTGIDLVGWMLRLARGEHDLLDGVPDTGPPVTGVAVEARICAEDPARDHRPSSGLLTRVAFGPGVRVDGWVETGTVVGHHYDPMLAKVVAHRPTRAAALDALGAALDATAVDGVCTNLDQLRAAVREPAVRRARHTTATLGAGPGGSAARIDVLRGGTMTTVQDLPGRTGLWEVGIPPSGPMDDLSFRLANRCLGNPDGTPALEATLTGPALRFTRPGRVCVTGAGAPVTVDGDPVPMWTGVDVPAGGLLDVGAPTGAGLRTYVALAGGLDVPSFQGSASTFTLGGFGGYTGRALATGDVLAPGSCPAGEPAPAGTRPEIGHEWELAVTEGPQPAPDYFTPEDMRQFYDTAWTVQSHANRSGIRLSGPRPRWARPDGGDAGLHPSNLHDNAYSVGALNVSGDTPILLGPDGPSLGGFACPLTVVSGHRWKLGQIRPGDTVRFVPVGTAAAGRIRADDGVRSQARLPAGLRTGPDGDDGVLARRPAGPDAPAVAYRRGGDDNLLVEYGEQVLDLGLRLRVHALAAALREHAPAGLVDLTPGVRSLHVHVDPDVLSVRRLAGLLAAIEDGLPATDELAVPSRTIRLPLSFDDPVVRTAIERYSAGVRPDAPWLPSNIDFVRRINGLDRSDDVERIMFDAEYLVLGLGDVYLGAPLAVPVDPRHRLVTTKYNPARTWTAADTVGLGGSYLCVYGMESPGGYQLVGRTVPIWSGYRQRPPFEDGVPWLLRFFDRIRWYPVTPDELAEQRTAFAAGRFQPEIGHGEFTLAAHRAFLARNAGSIAAFERRRGAAFAAERDAWRASGELGRVATGAPAAAPPAAPRTTAGIDVPPGARVVEAPMAAGVWRMHVTAGDRVTEGEPLLTLEAMKLEMDVPAPVSGTVLSVHVAPGDQVDSGHSLAVIGERAA